VQDPHALLPALIAAAVVEQEHGELAAAVSLAEEFLETRRVPNWMQTELSRIALAAGDPKLAERLIGSGGPAGSRFAVMALANRAACSESNGSQEEAVELYGDALVGFRDLGCVVEQAYALLGLGRCRLALGQEAEARSRVARGARNLPQTGRLSPRHRGRSASADRRGPSLVTTHS